jgi:RNA polymerase sigma-70 factor (ECF subfamily)
MLGSAFDAEDAVQETMVRAWRHLGQFDERASLRTWLYRIATNVCLDELKHRGRRALPIEEGAPSAGAPRLEALTQRPAGSWIGPIQDASIVPTDADPSERAILRQSVRLAFVAALQHLAPKQRAALLLVEVLGCSAAETADILLMSVAAVNSALQRARAALATRHLEEPADLTDAQRDLVNRYVAAFERYDIEGLTGLLRTDATFCMPPYALWFQGPDEVKTWMLGLGNGCRGSRLVPVAACGLPGFAQYRPDSGGGHTAWALIVLELAGAEIASVTYFLHTATVFPRFDLPLTLPT